MQSGPFGYGYEFHYLVVTALILLALLFAATPLLIARWLAPRKPGREKAKSFECGVEGEGDSWIQFRIPFYYFALLFLIFDVEVVFLFPWALVYRELGLNGLLTMGVFIALLSGGLAWAWRRGFLEWRA